MDVLANVLQTVRLHGALFLHAEFREPWCVDVPEACEIAAEVCAGAERLAMLHLVLEGRCRVRAGSGAAIELAAGDIVVLPHGAAHLLGSGLERAAVDLQHVVQPAYDVGYLRYGGDGPACLLACGWFAFERDIRNPLLAALPGMFRASLSAHAPDHWLLEAVRTAVRDQAGRVPGAPALSSRIAEALFIEALRIHLTDEHGASTGWAAALRDPRVGRCLALMHEQWNRAWTVESLAAALHTSRSVLSDRFSTLVGMPPMQYLRSWRLAHAARMLRSSRAGIGQIAVAAGYTSEAAFSRAFKAEFGAAPLAWRRGL